MSRLILVTGGVRSGKSTYAQNLAKSSKRKVLYFATAEALDADMKERIRLHKKGRDKNWITIEEPLNVFAALKKFTGNKRTILIDCLTLFISNLIFKGLSDKAVCGEVRIILEELRKKSELSIVVTNEVGSGIVPENKLARRFRDLQGRVNQIAAKEAECVYLLVSGIPVKIKGEKEDV